MLIRMLRFELKYHFGQLSFIITALLFALLGCVCAVKAGFGGSEVHRNAPYVVANIVALFSLLTIFAGTLFSANVVLRDSIYKMEAVVFTTSVKRGHYFAVRFLGLLIAVFLLMVLTVLGIFLGSFFVNSDDLGAFNISYLLQPLLVFGLPNVLFVSVLIFCTALLTKNVRAIYATGVLLYILYMVASILGNSPLLATSTLKTNGHEILPFLIDPFGLASFFSNTRGWTSLQRNQQLFPVQGAFLANRLLWLGFSAVVLGISYRFFNFRLQTSGQSKPKGKTEQQPLILPFKHVKTRPTGGKYHFTAFYSQFKLEVISLLKHIPFMVMMLLWVFLFGVELKDSILHGPYGIKYYPTTGAIIEVIRAMKFGLVLLVFYAAELIARELASNIQSLIYSTPVKSPALWAAKCLTLCVLVVILVTLNIGTGIVLQLTNGYFDLDLPYYLSLYYYSACPFFLFVVLIVFVQNISANKYLGMLLNLLVVFVFLFGPRLGIEHYLLRFAAVPDLQFSYFNGFGYYKQAFNWYMLYWAGFAGMLAILTIGMWQNSTQHTFATRLRAISAAVYKSKFVFAIATLICIASGIFIYRQTNVIGKYQSTKEQLDWRVGYEKKYKAFAQLPQPIIKSVKTNVDLFTTEGRYRVKGTYRLKNESDRVIAKLWVSLHQSVNHFEVTIPGAQKHNADKLYNQQFIDLKTPLQPGAELTMDFSFEVIRSGFVSFDTENSLVDNGSYIELEKFVPQFGYNPDMEIADARARRMAGLSPLSVTSSDDRNYHLINLETTVSTEADQQVVTVGTLQKTWLANNRRYFNYKTEGPINFMFALSSARYAVKTENYKGVQLRAYYHPGHQYNLKTMLRAVKDALDYGDTNFSAYPLKQFTLAEIPQYRGAATAYPGLLFNAERINYLTDYRDNDNVDQSYAITVHEVAHQWWANKLAPVPAPGAAMLTESLAKYTEAAVIEKTFGKMYLSSYLKQDNNLYFAMRDPGEEERPLAQTYGQNYVNYQKGGLAMYAVKEALGEKVFNNALKELILRHASPNPKAKAADLVNILLKLAPADKRKFIDDSFNQVVTYNLAVKVLACKATPDGKFRVELLVNTILNKQGTDKLFPADLTADIALFDGSAKNRDKNTAPFYLQKHHFNAKQTKLTIIADKKPGTVAIDPFSYLLDDNLDDNIRDIK